MAPDYDDTLNKRQPACSGVRTRPFGVTVLAGCYAGLGILAVGVAAGLAGGVEPIGIPWVIAAALLLLAVAVGLWRLKRPALFFALGLSGWYAVRTALGVRESVQVPTGELVLILLSGLVNAAVVVYLLRPSVRRLYWKSTSAD